MRKGMRRKERRRESWLTIRLTNEERKVLETLAEQYATTLSTVARLALVKFLREEGIISEPKVEAENQLGLFA